MFSGVKALCVTLGIILIFIVADLQAKDCPETSLNCSQNQTARGGFDCNHCFNAKCVRCAYLTEKKCYCKEGYIRVDANTGDCVRTEDCPACVPSDDTDCSCALKTS